MSGTQKEVIGGVVLFKNVQYRIDEHPKSIYIRKESSSEDKTFREFKGFDTSGNLIL